MLLFSGHETLTIAIMDRGMQGEMLLPATRSIFAFMALFRDLRLRGDSASAGEPAAARGTLPLHS